MCVCVTARVHVSVCVCVCVCVRVRKCVSARLLGQRLRAEPPVVERGAGGGGAEQLQDGVLGDHTPVLQLRTG